MKQSVLVLNADHSLINIVNWKRALLLIAKGKAEVVERTGKEIRNFEGTKSFFVPSVIRLVTFVRHVFNAKVSFSKSNVMIRDKHTCVYCGSKEDLTVDHVHPTSKGGKSTWENCVTACKPCNIVKSNKSLRDVGYVLKRTPYQPTMVQYFQNKIEFYGIDAMKESFSKKHG